MVCKPIDYNIIGPRIARARKDQKMTEAEFCDRLELAGIRIGPYQLSLIENQEAQIFDYQLLIFAKALDVPIDWLFEGLENIRPYRRSTYE